jgi:hypothetical protein
MSGSKAKQTGDTPELVRLTVGAEGISHFFPLFQEGVMLDTETGKSVREFLCATLGIDEDYVEGRISTIFLDSKPVDDLDTSIVDDGAVLALSAAMPGLVGATMRRGGYYAAMRSAISYWPDTPEALQYDSRGNRPGAFTGRGDRTGRFAEGCTRRSCPGRIYSRGPDSGIRGGRAYCR